MNTAIHIHTTLHKIRISHTSRNEGTDDSPYNSNVHHIQKPCVNIIPYWHIRRAKPRYCGTDTALDCLRANIPRHSAATIAAEVGTKLRMRELHMHLQKYCSHVHTYTYTYSIHIHKIKHQILPHWSLITRKPGGMPSDIFI